MYPGNDDCIRNGVVYFACVHVEHNKMASYMCDIVHCALVNGVDSYVNEGQWLSECQVSLAEREKEQCRFLTVSGSVGRRPFWKVLLYILVLFYM